MLNMDISIVWTLAVFWCDGDGAHTWLALLNIHKIVVDFL